MEVFHEKIMGKSSRSEGRSEPFALFHKLVGDEHPAIAAIETCEQKGTRVSAGFPGALGITSISWEISRQVHYSLLCIH